MDALTLHIAFGLCIYPVTRFLWKAEICVDHFAASRMQYKWSPLMALVAIPLWLITRVSVLAWIVAGIIMLHSQLDGYIDSDRGTIIDGLAIFYICFWAAGVIFLGYTSYKEVWLPYERWKSENA